MKHVVVIPDKLHRSVEIEAIGQIVPAGPLVEELIREGLAARRAAREKENRPAAVWPPARETRA